MPARDRRALGSSGIEVSALSLGSWMTFEHLPRETGVAILRAAREHGIDFLDDARYDDRTGTAPMPTGYSEVVFGELFRAAGWRRDEAVVANKLWWEFWPSETAAEEVDGSLRRMGFDYLDLVYSAPPRDGLSMDDIVGAVGELIAAGKVRAWGFLYCPAGVIAGAAQAESRAGVPPPCAAQLVYSLVARSPVEDDDMARTLRETGVSAVASFAMAGGALTGKYAAVGAAGRLAGRLDDPVRAAALEAGRELVALARELGTTPAALAIAFPLLNPTVASVLFGATGPEQVAENAAAPAVLAALDDDARARLALIGH